MDVDIDDYEAQIAVPRQLHVQRRPHIVDDEHPFDLDAYITNYNGRTAVDRLVHIIGEVPTLSQQALRAAPAFIRTLRDSNLYDTVVSAYESVRQSAPEISTQLPPATEVIEVDTRWVDETKAANQKERQKLETELKTYTTNMIKESIRMAHRDLGAFYRAVGEPTTALKHFVKSREFCTTSHQVLEQYFSCLELLIEQRNYAHIGSYVYKTESTLDSLNIVPKASQGNSSAPGAAAAPGGAVSSKKPGAVEREKVQSKLEYASALSKLGQGHYEGAANAFLRIGPPKSFGDWLGTLVAPGDIAIYGTLCSLASFTRGAIKARVLDNDHFGVYIEQEPYIRDLIDAYMGSKFSRVLELLERFSTRHYADYIIASHVHDLTNLIRDRALVLYFQPFASIRLERMSQAFGFSIPEIEKAVVGLIQSGQIKARLDSQNKILKAREVDPRAELFQRATKTGAEMQSATRKLLLRMKLQQADLVVKGPKQDKQQGGVPSDYTMGE